MEITLFEIKYESLVAWGISDADKVVGYAKMTFDPIKITFTISTPNFLACFRNPFTVIQKAIEHEGVGMQKYDALKDKLRTSGMWKQL